MSSAPNSRQDVLLLRSPLRRLLRQPASAPATVPLPMSKMAVIYTDLFLDQKTGIAKFNSVVTKLNGEFQAVRDELTQMQTSAQQLEDEINKLQTRRPARRSISVRCRPRSINWSS